MSSLVPVDDFCQPGNFLQSRKIRKNENCRILAGFLLSLVGDENCDFIKAFRFRQLFFCRYYLYESRLSMEPSNFKRNETDISGGLRS